MRVVLAIGIIGLILLEIATVYFIMPLPGSQGMRSIDAAYTLCCDAVFVTGRSTGRGRPSVRLERARRLRGAYTAERESGVLA